MNSLLQEAIAGESVTVTLGHDTYPLAYPIQAVILYKRETALLDRERAKDRPRLTHEEKRSLRSRRQKLMVDADLQRPAKGQDWQPEKFLEFDLLMDEASALKIALDEDAGTGDSLYDMYNWRKISPDGDPERLLLALWIGLHHFVVTGLANTEEQYRPTLSRQQLGNLVDLGNGGDLTMAISKALSAHLIAQSEESAMEHVLGSSPDDPPVINDWGSRGDFDPNPQPPASPAVIQTRPDQHPKGIQERRAFRRLETNPQK
jgi:hypothetical protein